MHAPINIITDGTDDHFDVFSFSAHGSHWRGITERRGEREGGGSKHDKKRQWVVSVSVVGSAKPEDEWVWPWGWFTSWLGLSSWQPTNPGATPHPYKIHTYIVLFFNHSAPIYLVSFSFPPSLFPSSSPLFHTRLHSVSPLLIPFPDTSVLSAARLHRHVMEGSFLFNLADFV